MVARRSVKEEATAAAADVNCFDRRITMDSSRVFGDDEGRGGGVGRCDGEEEGRGLGMVEEGKGPRGRR